MTRIQFNTLGVLAVILLVTAALARKSKVSNSFISKNIKGDGFIVLELFTSEGCSSCPPADELLAKVQREAGNKPIYVLSYHVDYWDHQGWKDIFGNAEYTKRQYQYARKLQAQVYTPQAIVNGKAEFVGSDESAMKHILVSGLTGTPSISLKLQGKQKDGRMDFSYQVSESLKNDELIIALIQKTAINHIKNGENGGRTLKHAQIVRHLEAFKLALPTYGQASVALPEDFTLDGWEVIGMLQDEKTKIIHAATRATYLN